jgi:membrane protein required for colicin V production
MEISWIDVGIAFILLMSVAIAMFRGFVKEAVSLASWIAAIWLAVTFSHQVALFLPASIDEATFSLSQSEIEASKLRIGIAFVLIVIGTLIAGSLLH